MNVHCNIQNYNGNFISYDYDFWLERRSSYTVQITPIHLPKKLCKGDTLEAFI